MRISVNQLRIGKTPSLAIIGILLCGGCLLNTTFAADSDNDGLDDDYEATHFLNPYSSDTDSDGLDDLFENNWWAACLNPLSSSDGGANGDVDNDGLTNDEERYQQTNPCITDTDGDGLWDGEEVHTYGTFPTYADSDGDGTNDGAEVLTYFTDPLDPDSHP